MDWVADFDQKIADYLPDLTVIPEEPMSKHTSFRVGGPAKRMAFPQRAEQLVLLLEFARQAGADPLLLGNGSNLLVPDGGLDRLVIHTAGLNRLEAGPEPETILAEAGVSLAHLADFACKQGLTGLEFAHGIPGTVGGGLTMNAGAYGREMAQVIVGASVLFPEEGVRFLPKEELCLGYRRSIMTQDPTAAVLHGVFRLESGDPEAIRQTMRDLLTRRKEKQPLEYPSAGSFFKRPEGQFAGALIEQCGLKGLTVGGAQVSEKHAGFLINRGGASCRDILDLMEQVQERVFAQTGVRLEPEVRILSN